ncbi:hypothetical protein DSCO28_00860 [Desulfosarcina ovata subsp. sediminis]|uniref:Uncharacterized protein n=1 Tax=Desulfosarcina ovata subsp. sediminis TaxID=885957 RepID=A0A5K7ZM49_9BACT|nr:hypothetical protein DSCO28_00860 [Desulfosarcina ovata subsp. sediminis]
MATEVELSLYSKNNKFTIEDIKSHQNIIRKRIETDLNLGKTPKEINQWLLNESLNIISAHPFLTYQFFVINILEKLKGPMPWWVYQKKMPADSLVSKIIPKLILFYALFTKVSLFLVLVFGIIVLILSRFKLNNAKKVSYYNYLALLLIFLYFSILSGFTFWTGPRIIFPAHFALISMFFIGIFNIWDTFHLKR